MLENREPRNLETGQIKGLESDDPEVRIRARMAAVKEMRQQRDG